MMRQLGGAIDSVDAAHRAYVAIGHIVQKQAYILAFSDTFYALGAALIVAMLASLLLKKHRSPRCRRRTLEMLAAGTAASPQWLLCARSGRSHVPSWESQTAQSI